MQLHQLIHLQQASTVIASIGALYTPGCVGNVLIDALTPVVEEVGLSLLGVNKVQPALLGLSEFSSQSILLVFGGSSRGKDKLPFPCHYPISYTDRTHT
jgi:hypothetical protein